VARALVRAYPPSWRVRYGEELESLISELRLRPDDVLDLARDAVRARLDWLSTTGGRRMDDRWGIWLSRGLGLLAMAATLPSAAFVVMNLLQYQFGVAVDQESAWWFAHSSGAVTLLGYAGGPLIGLGIAALAMGRCSMSKSADGGLVVTLRVLPSRWAIAGGALSAAVLLTILGYLVSENLLEALRAG
jgi:hypothetical protein